MSLTRTRIVLVGVGVAQSDSDHDDAFLPSLTRSQLEVAGIWRGRSYPRTCDHVILYSFKHYKIKIIYYYIMVDIVLTF